MSAVHCWIGSWPRGQWALYVAGPLLVLASPDLVVDLPSSRLQSFWIGEKLSCQPGCSVGLWYPHKCTFGQCSVGNPPQSRFQLIFHYVSGCHFGSVEKILWGVVLDLGRPTVGCLGLILRWILTILPNGEWKFWLMEEIFLRIRFPEQCTDHSEN